MQKQKIIFTVTNNLEFDQRMHRICQTLSSQYEIELVGRNYLSTNLKRQDYAQTRLSCFFNKGKLFYLEYNLRLLFYLFFSKVDIVCAIDLDTIVPCYYVSKLTNKKLVYDAHEYFTEVIEVVSRPKVQKIWQMVESYFVPKIKNAYTVSEGLQKLFTEKYNVTFGLVRNISSIKHNATKSTTIPYLIYAGVVNEGRGIKELLEAMQSIDMELLICGYGDVFDEMSAYSAELQVSHKVKFMGNIPPAQLAELINNAYAGILLLENKGLSYYYSLANKFFDYIHGEIPQITINFPEYQILNEKYHVALLVPLEVSKIVSTLNELIDNKELYHTLVENCKIAKQELNWENESQTLLKIYQELK